MVEAYLDSGSVSKTEFSAYFSTRNLASHERFDAWRERNREIIELLPGDDPTDGFDVDNWSWTMGDVVLERSLLPRSIERRWYHLPKSYRDHWCVVVVREREAANPAAVGTTRVHLRSLTEPFEGRGRDDDIITLFVPRDSLSAKSAVVETERRGELQGPAARILANHLVALTHEIGGLTQETRVALAGITCALVSACIAPTPERLALAERPIFSALRERARRIVHANMASPDFTPQALARLLFVSRSKLYRIFEPHGGVARFLQRERLAEAHRRLTEEFDTISISDLSIDVGFRDHSAFSRAFKAEFGISPRDAREEALALRLAGGRVEPKGASCPVLRGDDGGRPLGYAERP